MEARVLAGQATKDDDHRVIFDVRVLRGGDRERLTLLVGPQLTLKQMTHATVSSQMLS